MDTFIRRWHDTFLLEYALFGLPWIISGALLPYILGIAVDYSHLHWISIILAFLTARSAGMALNRLIDCEIDRKNPRTKMRAFARGDLKKIDLMAVIGASFILFFFCCYFINAYIFFLSPFVALLLVSYSYTKRITSMCHFVLGGIHFLGPIMSFAAVSGAISSVSILLGLALFMIISSGDIFYALQDIDYDREHGLYSIPAKLGYARAISLAHALQVVAVLILCVLGIISSMSFPYFIGCAVVAFMYIIAYLKGWHSFVMNSYVGIVMMLAFWGEYVWRR